MSESNKDDKFKLSVHEKCSDPCPAFRKRIKSRPDITFKGFWGPYIESPEGEIIAEGHREVKAFLDGGS